MAGVSDDDELALPPHLEELVERLVKESPLKGVAAKTALARTVAGLILQRDNLLRKLQRSVEGLTSDEQRCLSGVASNIGRTLERMKITESVDDGPVFGGFNQPPPAAPSSSSSDKS